jgi:hypothetical protein
MEILVWDDKTGSTITMKHIVKIYFFECQPTILVLDDESKVYLSDTQNIMAIGV